MNEIHETAIVSKKANIGNNNVIGPFTIIEDDVEIGNDCEIGSHVSIYNGARVGNKVKIFQGASIANAPQDLKYANEETFFHIGDETVIREFVTLHRGTVETGFSKVGSNCLLMAYAHVAHDCVIGNKCILANGVQIGGHVEIEDWVIIGGMTPVHQFSKIGAHAMVAGAYRVIADIPPFVLAANEPLRYTGLNVLGLRRRGFSNEDITTIKEAYNIIYNSKLNFKDARISLAEKYPDNENIKHILNFFEKSNRAIIRK